LRYLRLHRRLTQQELARLAGIGQTYISELEHNKRSNPSIEVLGNLARGLNVSLEVLLEADNQPSGSNLEPFTRFEHRESNEDLQNLIKVWFDLTISERETLVKTALSLVKKNKIG